jgi:V-type H(+)-translocating pyrophosphatase
MDNTYAQTKKTAQKKTTQIGKIPQGKGVEAIYNYYLKVVELVREKTMVKMGVPINVYKGGNENELIKYLQNYDRKHGQGAVLYVMNAVDNMNKKVWENKIEEMILKEAMKSTQGIELNLLKEYTRREFIQWATKGTYEKTEEYNSRILKEGKEQIKKILNEQMQIILSNSINKSWENSGKIGEFIISNGKYDVDKETYTITILKKSKFIIKDKSINYFMKIPIVLNNIDREKAKKIAQNNNLWKPINYIDDWVLFEGIFMPKTILKKIDDDNEISCKIDYSKIKIKDFVFTKESVIQETSNANLLTIHLTNNNGNVKYKDLSNLEFNTKDLGLSRYFTVNYSFKPFENSKHFDNVDTSNNELEVVEIKLNSNDNFNSSNSDNELEVMEGMLNDDGNFEYNVGEIVDLILFNGVILKVGKNSSETYLVKLLEDEDIITPEQFKKNWITLDRTYFKTGSDELTEDSVQQLKNIVAILNAYPKAVIRLGSYTDNTGSDEDNFKLSIRRADSILNKLVALGANKAQLDAQGYGSDHPICPANDTPECKAKNRRIDIRLKSK